MLRELFETGGVVLLIVAASAAIIIVPAVIFYAVVDPRICEAQWGDRGEWGFWSSCMVDTNRGTIPAGSLTPADIGVEIAQ